MRKSRILITEDDGDALFLLNGMLTKHGYEVEQVRNCTELFSKPLPSVDLVVLDNEMRVMDGIAVCKYLKTNLAFRNIPIIMIAADHKCRERAIRAGVSHFINKPIDSGDLVNTVKELLSTEIVH